MNEETPSTVDTYFRVVNHEELITIRTTNVILPSNSEDWGDYPPNTVIFFFRKYNLAFSHIYSQIEDKIGANEGTCGLISFTYRDDAFEEDTSAVSAFNSFVFRGILDLTKVTNLCIYEIIKIKPYSS